MSPRNVCLPKRWEEMIQWIQRRICLKGFQYDAISENTWTQCHSDIVVDFLSNTSSSKLLVAYDPSVKTFGQRIICSTSNLPLEVIQRVDEISYFVRSDCSKTIDISNIEYLVHYGTVASRQTPNSVKEAMHKIYWPQIKSSLGQRIESYDLIGHYHRFMASLTERINDSSGDTLLYVPSETDFNLNDVNKNTRKTLESIVMFWTKQIITLTNESECSRGDTFEGEISFWKRRVDVLSCVVGQLENIHVKNIIQYLSDAHSTYLNAFHEATTAINVGMNKASENVKYLSILEEPCNDLASSDLSNLPSHILNLFNCVRIIQKHSCIYNAKPQISNLLRRLSNEIINYFRSKIDSASLLRSDVVDIHAVQLLEDSITYATLWKTTYHDVASFVNTSRGLYSWEFDEKHLFGQLNMYILRCNNLLDVCLGKNQFNAIHLADSQLFGGVHGLQITQQLQQLGNSFARKTRYLSDISYEVLDLASTDWHDDYNTFKSITRKYESKYVAIVQSAFDNTKVFKSALVLLKTFYSLVKRDNIRSFIEGLCNKVGGIFCEHCDAVEATFDNEKVSPILRENEPTFAGAAFWAEGMRMSIEEEFQQLKLSSLPFDETYLNEFESKFLVLHKKLIDFQFEKFRSWEATLSSFNLDEIQNFFQEPVFRRESIDDSKLSSLLVCNFDERLCLLYMEAEYFEKHKTVFDIPQDFRAISHKRDDLFYTHSQMMLITKAHSDLLRKLSPEEYRLFSDFLNVLERHIRPGFTKITWSSRPHTIDRFTENFLNELSIINRAVEIFQTGKMNISKVCKKFCNLMLVDINNNSVYKEGNFESQQFAHRVVVTDKLEDFYNSITIEMNKLHEIFKSSNTREVHSEWISFVKSVDKAVESGLFTSVKQSLLKINKVCRNDSYTLFRVELVLQNSRIECKPTMIEVTHSLNSIAKGLIQSINKLMRVSSLFLPPSSDDKSYYEVVSSKDDILTILAQIMNAVVACANGINNEIEYWNKHKSLWELDIDAFMRRYSLHKKPLDSTLKDISRYTDQKEVIDEESNSRRSMFIDIDVTSLKGSLATICEEWITKLTVLLHQNAKEQLRNFYTEIRLIDQKHTGSSCHDFCSNKGLYSETKESIKVAYQALVEKEQFNITLEEHEMLSAL